MGRCSFTSKRSTTWGNKPLRGTAGLGPYLVLQWMCCVLVSLSYLHTANAWSPALGASFATTALLGQTGTFVLLQAIILLALTHARTPHWAVHVLCATLTTLMLGFFIIDTKIYGVYRFHFNGFILNVLFTPGGLQTVGFSALDKAIATSMVAGLFMVSGAVRLGCERLARSRPRLNTAASRGLVAAVVFFAVTERSIYAWADYHDAVAVTRLQGMLPFYEPFLIRGNLEQTFGPAEKAHAASQHQTDWGSLQYPGPEFTLPLERTPNIVVIAIESLRYDMLNPEVMPNLWEWSTRAQRFDSHHSGGNATRYGIFSLLYGTHGYHWQQFLTHRRGPALLSVLRNAGYKQGHFTSASMDYPEFRQTVFINDTSSLNDKAKGDTSWQRDVSTRDGFLSFLAENIKGDSSQPFASFVFFDGPHAPYSFPDDHEFFRATQNLRETYLDLIDRDKAVAAKVKYMNAVHYADKHLGKIFQAIEDQGLYENTIVVVTGDHGQEFWEFGTYGHNAAFNPMQIQVPFVLHAPGRPPHVHSHWTEHRDLVATLFELLGAPHPWPTNGRSLFDTNEREQVFACSFTECALRDPLGWVVFGTSEKKSLKLQYLDTAYTPQDRASGATAERLERLANFFSEPPAGPRDSAP